VVGNPDLGAELALPWAEREARMVGQRQKDATVLVRADATEAQVKKLLQTAGVVHLATHGELSEDDPLSSAMLLVPGGGEDGRLEVREVFGLDMHARLVVLSACETGLGKLSRGDELVGLQRAFLYAGTPAVVTTLWKVDDKATFELVRSFYAHLESTGPVEALRQAQVETMRAFPIPTPGQRSVSAVFPLDLSRPHEARAHARSAWLGGGRPASQHVLGSGWQARGGARSPRARPDRPRHLRGHAHPRRGGGIRARAAL
jgi:CHAT domain-containing protein